MTFAQAQAVRLSFGKYNGRTLEQIASSDEGLRYLDWLVDQGWVRTYTREALGVYLSDPSIQAELADLLEDD